MHYTATAADVDICDIINRPNRDLALYPINLQENSFSKADLYTHRYKRLFRHTAYSVIVLTTLIIAIAVILNIA